MGGAARQAAHQIRQQLLEIGARVLEANVEDLQMVDGFLEVKGVPDKRRSIPQLFQARYGAAVGNMVGSFDNQTGGGLDPSNGKGKGFGLLFPVGLRGGSRGRYRHGKSNGAASCIRGRCGQSHQSSAMSHAERRIDDHVVGFGAV